MDIEEWQQRTRIVDPNQRKRNYLLWCDSRRAVLILNVVTLLWITIMLLLGLCTELFQHQSIEADNLVSLALMAAIFEGPLALLCIWGALNFVLWPLRVKMALSVFKLAISFMLGGPVLMVMCFPVLAFLYSTHGHFCAEVARGLWLEESPYCGHCFESPRNRSHTLLETEECTAVEQKETAPTSSEHASEITTETV